MIGILIIITFSSIFILSRYIQHKKRTSEISKKLQVVDGILSIGGLILLGLFLGGISLGVSLLGNLDGSF